eukprot:gene10401-2930_t
MSKSTVALSPTPKDSRRSKKTKSREFSNKIFQEIENYQILENQQQKIQTISSYKYKSDSIDVLLKSGNSILLFFISDLKTEYQYRMIEDFQFYFKKLIFLNINPILITSKTEEHFNLFYQNPFNFHVIFDQDEKILNNFDLQNINKLNEVCVLIKNENIEKHIIIESNKKRINFIKFVLNFESAKKVNSFYDSNFNTAWKSKRRSKALVGEKIDLSDVLPNDSEDKYHHAYRVLSPISLEIDEFSPEQKIEKKKRKKLFTSPEEDELKEHKNISEEKPLKLKQFSDSFIKEKTIQNSTKKNLMLEDSNLEDEFMFSNSTFTATFSNFVLDVEYDNLLNSMEKKDLAKNFCYESIYTNDVYFEVFKSFLKKEFSYENALFIEISSKYIQEKDLKKKIVIYEEIKSNFLNPDSEFEINISNRSKKHIFVHVESENYADNLFADIRKELKYGIMFDSFSRFIRTKEFNEMIQN